MNGTAIQAMLMQHAHSRDVEVVAKHYDDQLYEVAVKLKAQNERVNELEAELTKARSRNRSLSDQISTKERELIQARHDLTVHNAFIGGLRAVVDAFFATHPDSPLFEKTGRTKKDGTPETKLDRIHYERVDAEIAAAGIENPSPYRPT